MEFRIGPELSINMSKGDPNLYPVNPVDKYLKPSFGLLTGLNLKLWDGGITSGRVEVNSVFTHRVNLGPFVEGIPEYGRTLLPENKFNFTHLDLQFAFGFKL